jgi:Ohr subfamily peroxiredoxin
MKKLYTAVATAVGGREGQVTSSDNKLNLKLSMPKELGGSGGEGVNPEMLFAAGYSACFESAIRHIARLEKVTITSAKVTAEVNIGSLPEGGFGLSAALKVSLPDMDRQQAMTLIEKAHQVCPYSNATRGNIQVDLSLE